MYVGYIYERSFRDNQYPIWLDDLECDENQERAHILSCTYRVAFGTERYRMPCSTNEYLIIKCGELCTTTDLKVRIKLSIKLEWSWILYTFLSWIGNISVNCYSMWSNHWIRLYREATDQEIPWLTCPNISKLARTKLSKPTLAYVHVFRVLRSLLFW